MAAIPLTSPQAAPATLSRPSPFSELRAFYAVFLREWRIMRRYPSWVVAEIVWPVLFPAIYILSARALAGPDGSEVANFAAATGTSDYMGYIVIGTTVWMWQNISLWSVGFALRNEQFRGTLESNWLAPVWRFSFPLGSGLLQALTMVVFLALAGVQFRLLYGVRLEGDPLLLLLVFAASVPSIYGLGLAFASLIMAVQEANAFVFLVRGLVMVFCGVTFPVGVLPASMQAVAAWLPPTYAIRAIRTAALTRATLADLLPDVAIWLGFGAAWMLAGYLAFVWVDRRARRTGVLGQH